MRRWAQRILWQLDVGAFERLLSGVVTVATGTTAGMLGSRSFDPGWLDVFASTVLVPTALDVCFVMQEEWCASRLQYFAIVDEHIYHVRMLCASVGIFLSMSVTELVRAEAHSYSIVDTPCTR